MSAYGTKKPGSDVIQQLTFPAMYSDLYAVEREPLEYYPDPMKRPEALPMGNDLQAFYHEQKRRDANRMAMAGVEARNMSDYRFLNSHANYYKMPKPVLSQRRFANPSLGNQADIYSARPESAYIGRGMESSYRPRLSGGVLYTAEAQRWGRQKLRDRIGQLDAIDVAQQGFFTGQTLAQMPMRVGIEVPEGALPESVSTKTKIELIATLDGISNAVETSTLGSISYSDVVKFLRLLFRWASTADVEELKEVLEYANYIERALLGISAQMEEGGDATEVGRSWNAFTQTIYDTFVKVREYLTRMISVVNKSPAERKAASANFIKSLGFTRRFMAAPPEVANMLSDAARRQDAMETGLPARAFNPADDDVFISPRSTARRPRFAPSVRDRMGANNGAFFGEALPDGSDAAMGVRNTFRDMADAELQPEVVERGLEEEGVLPGFIRDEEGEEGEDAEAEPVAREPFTIRRRRRPQVAPVVEPVVEPAARYTRPTWLRTRDDIPRNDRDIRRFLQRLNNEGHGLYIPRDDTPYTVIRRRIINLWNL
jgi:hypothetical protein